MKKIAVAFIAVLLTLSLFSASHARRVETEIGLWRSPQGRMSFSVIEDSDFNLKSGRIFVSDQYVVDSVLLPVNATQLREISALIDETLAELESGG